MVAVLRHEPLLVVVGPSGIGKSSAVVAGCCQRSRPGRVPASERWLVTELVPEHEPFESSPRRSAASPHRGFPTSPERCCRASRAASARSSTGWRRATPGCSSSVDQLEELFTQTIDDVERRAFLANAGGPRADAGLVDVQLVATLHADYFDRPLA